MTRTLPSFVRPTALFACAILFAAAAQAQTNSQKAAVQLSASVQASPARITLNWTSLPSTSSITIYRKALTATSWGSAIASPGASALSYQDQSVSAGTAYEYRVVRVAGGVTGTGYISTGIAVPPVDYRGKMILLVDNTFTSSLSNELTVLERDLRMDGWSVVRSNLSRTASVASVKSTIAGHYNADPANTKAVFIIGHLAIPYSGNQAPDGHSEHSGAWPCDGYYGEMNGSWTDNSVNNSNPTRTQNRNVPGDGKFDQNNFPNSLELQVGRIDFYNMPAFSQNETELTRAYLNKLHGFKLKQWTPTARGLVFDNLQWVSNPLAASAWRSMAPLVGASNITAANQNATTFKDLVNNQSYLWAYGSGAGGMVSAAGELSYNSADRVGTTQDFASISNGAVFSMSFGSYFGDWDNPNNFLRAFIASGNGLVSCYSAIPGWYFHHMGMGANVGYSTLTTMNNTSLYTPLTDGWQGSIGRVHLSLHGDPSLRMKMLVPPSNLTVSNGGGYPAFAWQPSPEPVDGYHVYAFDPNTGAISRLTNNVVTGTSFAATSVPYAAGREYMVRAVKLMVEPSGSYQNLSLGVSATTPAGAAPDCQGVAGGSAVPGSACNDGNACTTNDTWNTSCQCAGTPTTPSATITAGGATSFCTGGSVVLSANTGSGLTYQWRRNGSNISGATGSSYTATTAGSYTVVVSSSGCSTTSGTTTVTITSAPSATISAGGATTFCSGSSVALNANTGSGYTYQWRRNGTALSGATASSYTASTSGSYTVVVSNGGCSTTSSATTVTVNAAPSATITAGGSTSFCAGGSVVLSVGTGSGYSYQWRRNGSNISGATGSSYTATTAGSYTVVVSGGGCATTSATTTVTIASAPSATISASGSTTFCAGSSVSLNANTGSGYTYQWRRNGSNVSGATASSYTVTTAGSYTVVVSNGGCSTTSSATTVTVNPAPTATITAGGATSFCTGGSVALSVGTGSGYSYQWRRNGSNISGATGSSYTATTAGSYTVVVSGGGCSTTSATTTVTVSSAPTASITNGSTASYCSGSSVMLTAATSSGSTYQWRRNGTALSGATSSSYQASSTGTYTVVVTNGGCSSTSSGTVVSSAASPTVSCSSNSSAGTVSASASGGTSPYAYAWSTTPVQTSATASVQSSGTYSVTVTGSNGCSSTCYTTITMSSSSSCTTPRTVSQGLWGQSPNSSNMAGYLATNWNAAFPAPNYLTVGCGSRIVRFTTSAGVAAALPTTGTAALLPSGTSVNPTNISNTLLGHLTALKISVRMDEIDPGYSPSGTLLRDMVVTSGTFGGWTVQQLINHADQAAGGCVSQYPLVVIASALANINNGYSGSGSGNGYLSCPSANMPLQAPGETMELIGEEVPPTVFPNPTSGRTTIVIPAQESDAVAQVELLSIAGVRLATLFNGRVEVGVPQQVAWEASAWPQGAYLCRVLLDDRAHHLRVIIE